MGRYKLALRPRFILGMALMLLPLFLLGWTAFYTHARLADAFSEVIEEAVQELDPVTELQVQVRESLMPPHDFLLSGNANERQLFSELTRKVDAGFAVNFKAPFGDPAEKKHLRAAYQEWQHVKALGSEIMNRSSTDGEQSPGLIQTMETMDIHADQLDDLLDRIHAVAHQEISALEEEARTANRNMRHFIGVIFLAGLGVAIGGGAWLTRSVLLPVGELEQGARHFAAGDLSCRLDAVREDELGRLMTTFNLMAETLEETQHHLREQSIRDPLTGLYNRREFMRLLTEEVERVRRYRHPLTLMMLDLDFFKRVNDTYGHPAGDAVLKGVARTIREELRTVDTVARYGGEEFAAILPETPWPEAKAAAERICRVVRGRQLAVSGAETIQVTVSIGLAVFPNDADSEQALLAAADKALYRAKRGGRDRVCWPGTPEDAPVETGC